MAEPRQPGERQIGLDALPVPAMIVAGPSVVAVNTALAGLLGQSRPRLLGRSLRELLASAVVAEDQGWLDAIDEARTERGKSFPHSVWFRLKTSTGDERHVSLRSSPGPGPGELCLVLVEATSESAARRLIEALAWAAGEFVRFRDEGKVLRAAVDVIHWQGFRAAALVLDGQHLRFGPSRLTDAISSALEQAHGQPLSSIRLSVRDMAGLDEVIAQGRARLLDAPGEGRFAALEAAWPAVAHAVVAPVFVEGEPLLVLFIEGAQLTPAAAAAIDLFATQIGSAIENVRHHHRAAERLTELQSLQRALLAQERMAVLGEAAAVLAHEIRSPLAVIRNALGLLASAHAKSDWAALRRIVEQETSRLEELVRDLLQLARPLEPRRCPVDLVALARRVIDGVRERAEPPEGAAIALELTAEPRSLELSVDASLMAMALENLLRNAIQASPPGGTVRLQIEALADQVRLAVEDEGSGIAPADADRIFEPFFTTRPSGTGLGLTIVKRVVQAHGGTVRLGRGASGGARFELLFPWR